MARFRAYTTDSEDDEDIQSAESSAGEDVESEADSPLEAEEEGDGENVEKALSRGVRYSAGHRQQEDSEDSELDSDGKADEDIRSESSDSSPPPRRDLNEPKLVPWVRNARIDPQRMQVMQQSLFRMPEEAEAMKEISILPSRKKFVLSNNLSRKHSRDSDGGDGLRAESLQVSKPFVLSI